MTVNPKLYIPPHITQRGIDSTLDECSFCATLVNLACATSGEYVTTPYGREMNKASLQAKIRHMRNVIGDHEGGITIDQRRELVKRLGFPTPERPNLSIGQVVDRLKAHTHTFSISGNPGDITGPSPVKRCDSAHEWAVVDIKRHDDDYDVRIFDPLRPGGVGNRGEWRPLKELRQFAYRDGAGVLTFLLAYPRGGWRQAKGDGGRTEKRLRDRIAALGVINATAKDAGRESAFVAVLRSVQALRTA